MNVEHEPQLTIETDENPRGYRVDFYLARLSTEDIGCAMSVESSHRGRPAATFWRWLHLALQRELIRRLPDDEPAEVEWLRLPVDDWSGHELAGALVSVDCWTYVTSRPVLGEFFDALHRSLLAATIRRLEKTDDKSD